MTVLCSAANARLNEFKARRKDNLSDVYRLNASLNSLIHISSKSST